MKKDLPADNEAMVITDMNALCRNSIELIRYARGFAVQHIKKTQSETWLRLFFSDF